MTVRQQGRTASARRRATSADPYGDLIRAAAPVAWWRGNGSTADEIAGGSAGTLVGTTYGTSILPARPGAQSFNLDGVDDHVTVPSQAKFNFAAPISMEAWFLADTLSGFGTVLGDSRMQIQHENNVLDVWTNNVRLLYTGLTSGTLYHVVATYDGTTKRLYLNGTQVASAAYSTALTGTPTIRIGTWDGAQEFFDGRIAELAIYNQTLTATAVTAHYTAGTTA